MRPYNMRSVRPHQYPPRLKVGEEEGERIRWDIEVRVKKTDDGFIKATLTVTGVDLQEHYKHPDLMATLKQFKEQNPGLQVVIQGQTGTEVAPRETTIEVPGSIATPEPATPVGTPTGVKTPEVNTL